MRLEHALLVAFPVVAAACAGSRPSPPSPALGRALLSAERGALEGEVEKLRTELEGLQRRRDQLERQGDVVAAQVREAQQGKEQALAEGRQARSDLTRGREDLRRARQRVVALERSAEAAALSLEEVEAAISRKREELELLEHAVDGAKGMTTVRDPGLPSRIKYLKTETDVYLGRFDLGAETVVVAGELASGVVKFLPFKSHRALSRDIWQAELRFELKPLRIGAGDPIPLLERPVYNLLQGEDEYLIPWEFDTPENFKEGEVIVRAHLDLPAPVPEGETPHTLINAPIPLKVITKIEALYSKLDAGLSALAGILGLVIGFLLNALGLFKKLRSALGGGGE